MSLPTLGNEGGTSCCTETWGKSLCDIIFPWISSLSLLLSPKSRALGPFVVPEELIWMDPIPSVAYAPLSTNDVKYLKSKILDTVNCSRVSISDLVKAAWASASTYRHTDHRGGANGGRIRLEPQRSWAVNDPGSLANVIIIMEEIQTEFNEENTSSNKQVSFADLIVLAGSTAIEEAARRAGRDIRVPFVSGRADALQSQTDIDSFNFLKPRLDGFRNYDETNDPKPEKALIDRAHLLTLSAPEMVVLVGGLRVLGANTGSNSVGILTDRPGILSNDYFLNLMDDSIIWSPLQTDDKLFQGNRPSGKPFTATRVDLILGSNSQLRAICETYACADSWAPFLSHFINAWTKVMNLDRFDLLQPPNIEESTDMFYYSSKRVSKL